MAGTTELALSATGTTASPALRARTHRLLAGSTLCLGSFLLFQIQPILAREILPWFGGAAAVWSTCLVFFQTTLFLGYLYAHLLLSKMSPAGQTWLHGVLLALSVCFLPVVPAASWKTAPGQDPLLHITGLLAVTAGLPYLLLSSGNPLLQGLIARVPNTRLPYRFYALSNSASLAALLAYPLITERLLSVRAQVRIWSVLYLVYVVLSACCLWVARVDYTPENADSRARPAFRSHLLWLLLAAVPATLSLAVTNHLTQNLAPVPLLWILPLSIYLVSLILCFESEFFCRRVALLRSLFGAAVLAAVYLLLHQSPDSWVRIQIPLFAGVLFAACMYFHSELTLRRPGTLHLSRYYLMLALGGAFGAVLVGLAAPYLLKGVYELPIAVAFSAVTVLFLQYRSNWIADTAWLAVSVLSVAAAAALVHPAEGTAVITTRNFYGALRVIEDSGYRTLVHGTVAHGSEFLDEQRANQPTSYYAPGSGVARAMQSLHRSGARVGVIGLGAGTLAAWARPRDFYRFYEINPAVIAIAERQFHYLRKSAGRTEVVAGDGRVSLEREEPQRFDLLVVDAFSGDSIPVHLLTREAFRLYFRHLAPDGMLALHLSNSALDLVPVAAHLAAAEGRLARLYHADADERLGRSESDWVLVAAPEAFLSRPSLSKAGTAPYSARAAHLWTDDNSNLFGVIRW